MSKVHLYKEDLGHGVTKMMCGHEVLSWDVEKYTVLDPKEVKCETCKRSEKYKSMIELDKQVSEIKEIEGEAMADFKSVERVTVASCDNCDNAMGEDCKITGRIEFDDNGRCSDYTSKVKHPAFDEPLNAHYKTGGIQTVDKIETILGHLKGKINLDQACQLYNTFKYYDRCENKGSLEKDLFKSADSICRAITGKFINEES